jgi:ADP-ribosylglycohydrolase
MDPTSRFRGCLLGGAVGDALGAPVEFLSLAEIRERFGAGGITEFAPAFGLVGGITDDTQMTLFTAEGLLRATSRWEGKGICHVPSVVRLAYLRWLRTQGFAPHPSVTFEVDGWLSGIPALHARRAPGRTCVTALEGERFGTVEQPLNHSKGCGGVMRMAPVGLVGNDPFRLGCELAALTHGHTSGFLAAGCFAGLVFGLVHGASLPEALEAARSELRTYPDHEEVEAALASAVAAAASGPPSAEAVERLGMGWVAEQALAIAVYCALVHQDDFAAGVRLAVNHGGDSDSTGAIAGNILGALLGVEAVPARWLKALELREEITAVADDLRAGYRDTDEWRRRYPGW